MSTAAESVSVLLEVVKCFVQTRTFVNVTRMNKIEQTEANRRKNENNFQILCVKSAKFLHYMLSTSCVYS
jgi:hypothetical protein